ncbi:MAG: translation initiation factor IF-6 [Candidatus Aenigmatarchaeota archaeon]
MELMTTNFFGDRNLGLYGFATDEYCFLGFKSKLTKKISKILRVKVFSSTILDTYLAGIFVTGNSRGIVLPKILEEYELKAIDVDVVKLESRYTALGNLILMNDSGIILSPLLRNKKPQIENFFKIPCRITTIAGMNMVGSLAIATNKGCLTAPKITETEKKILEETLRVPIDIGTVSFGTQFVKSGIIANSNGFLASDTSSGPELGRINEALGFL